jgi:cytochrome c oxidase subunit IV
MSGTHSAAGYKSYWITWGILLAVTGVMLLTEVLALPAAVLISILLAAMLVKASLIGAQFMHLRFENTILIIAVAGSILFFSAFLFILIAFDGLRILKMVQP